VFLAVCDCSYALCTVTPHTLLSYRILSCDMANINSSNSGNILLLPSQLCVLFFSARLIDFIMMYSDYHHHHHPCILVITFMRGIYNYICETNIVFRVYIVPADVYVHWNMFCTFTVSFSAVWVQCPMWSQPPPPLILCFPGVLVGYGLSDFEMVPFTPCYYWYQLCFHNPLAFKFCYNLFVYYNLTLDIIIIVILPQVIWKI
jgi:hypothetical protein